MMKRLRALPLIMFFGFLCAGCSPGTQVTKVALKDLSVTSEQVSAVVAKIKNFSAADNLRIALPADVGEYYDMNVGVSQPEGSTFEEFYAQSVEFTEYVLGEKMYPDAFYYHGKNSDYQYNYDIDPETGDVTVDGKPAPEGFDQKVIAPPNKIYDYYGKLVSGEEDYNAIEYFTQFLPKETDKNVYLAFCNPIGISYLRFNKSETINALYGTPEPGEERHQLGSWQPYETEPMLESYLPNSDAEVELLNGKTTIAAAAKFCEDYLSKVPYPKNPTFSLKVAYVKRFQIGGKSGLWLLLSPSYNGILFDFQEPDVHTTYVDHTSFWCYAYMCYTDDVDILYNLPNGYIIKDKTADTEIIDVGSAIGVIAKGLTNEIPFELRKVEMVYCQKKVTDEQISHPENFALETKLAWKITLFSPNDNMTYVTYVDAKDGGNLRYYVIYP